MLPVVPSRGPGIGRLVRRFRALTVLPAVVAVFCLSTAAPCAQTPLSAVPRLTPEARGDIYVARKMYREAIDVYRQGEAEAKEPREKAVLEDKVGMAWHQLGQTDAALKAYRRAVKFDPAYADAINNVGTVYYAQKRYNRAISQYRKALALNPDAAAIWSNLGTAWFERHKFALMADAYAKALALDPDIFQARTGPGTEMEDRAVEDRARYHFEMARIYAKAGKNDLALQYLRKSMEEGFRDKERIGRAPEFTALRAMPEFKQLMTLEPRVL